MPALGVKGVLGALLLGLALVLGSPVPGFAQPATPETCSGPQPRPAPCAPEALPLQEEQVRPEQVPPPVERECGLTNPSACIGEGMASFMDLLVGQSLNAMLGWLGESLLSTPTLDELPRVGELWEQSRLLVVASYSLLVMAAGVVLMLHGGVRGQQSVREVLPRLGVGFLAANLSLPVGDQAIRLANAVSATLLDGGLDPVASGRGLRELLVALAADAVLSGGLFTAVLGVVLVVLLVALLTGYVVRVALTVLFLVGAPLALMWHGLEQTSGVSTWFVRAGAGLLGVQVGQSMTLVCALAIFLQPGGFRFLGGGLATGLVNMVVLIALMWVLVKIPGWVMRQVNLGSGKRSFVGGLIRAAVFGKALGLVSGRGVRPALAAAGRSGGVPRRVEPVWPAPIREWGGLAGVLGPEAVARRLHARHAAELARRQTVSRQQHLLFQQAPAQHTTHDLASWKPGRSTAAPEFSSPSEPARPLADPLGRPEPARFLAQRQRPGARLPVRPGSAPSSPVFRQPAVERVVPASRASAPPAPVVFQPAVRDTGDQRRRARSHTPAPVVFQAPDADRGRS